MGCRAGVRKQKDASGCVSQTPTCVCVGCGMSIMLTTDRSPPKVSRAATVGLCTRSVTDDS